MLEGTRFKRLWIEASKLAKVRVDVMGVSDFFSRYLVDGSDVGPDDTYHFTSLSCVQSDRRMEDRIVACVRRSDPDNVTYHRGGECPHRDYAIL